MAFDVDDPHPETRADFALMETRPGALQRYWRLAVETSNYQKRLKAEGIFKYPTWPDVSRGTALVQYLGSQIPSEHHDQTLFARWEAWASEYEQICEASPKWHLKQMISEVSEAVSCMSWPKRWERDIWEWAVSPKDNDECPFRHYRGTLDADFRTSWKSLLENVTDFCTATKKPTR